MCIDLIQLEVNQVNKKFANVEQVKKFTLIDVQLTAEDDEVTQKKISVAIKGLSQLQMYDTQTLNNGDSSNPNCSVQLEQNPMPKPGHL